MNYDTLDIGSCAARNVPFDANLFHDTPGKIQSALLYNTMDHARRCVVINCDTCYSDRDWLMRDDEDFFLYFMAICKRIKERPRRFRDLFISYWQQVGRPAVPPPRINRRIKDLPLCVSRNLHRMTVENTRSNGQCVQCYRLDFPRTVKLADGSVVESCPKGHPRLEAGRCKECRREDYRAYKARKKGALSHVNDRPGTPMGADHDWWIFLPSPFPRADDSPTLPLWPISATCSVSSGEFLCGDENQFGRQSSAQGL